MTKQQHRLGVVLFVATLAALFGVQVLADMIAAEIRVHQVRPIHVTPLLCDHLGPHGELLAHTDCRRAAQ